MRKCVQLPRSKQKQSMIVIKRTYDAHVPYFFRKNTTTVYSLEQIQVVHTGLIYLLAMSHHFTLPKLPEVSFPATVLPQRTLNDRARSRTNHAIFGDAKFAKPVQ